MKEGPFSFLTGFSGWAFYCAMISTFGLAGYYSELLRRFVPDWVGVGLIMAPLVTILLIPWGEFPDRVVAVTHTVAASWFMILAVGMEVGGLLGYEPRDSGLFRVMAHVGWTFAWGGIYRRARARSREMAEQGAAPSGSPAAGSGN